MAVISPALHCCPCFKLKPRVPSIGLKPNPPNFNFKRQSCRAVFSEDAPFAAAIGASMLTSLLFPLSADADADADEEDGGVNPADARLAVMGIVSFIPYFNWLSWVFAWLDTGKRRYALYALVYLAPYLRSNLSLSPQESWLPIASIFFCIVHIQLEASIINGDIQGFQLFRNVTHRKKRNSKISDNEEGSMKDNMNLPPAEEVQEQSRDINIIGGWEDSQRPSQYRQRLNEDDIDDDGAEHRSKH